MAMRKDGKSQEPKSNRNRFIYFLCASCEENSFLWIAAIKLASVDGMKMGRETEINRFHKKHVRHASHKNIYFKLILLLLCQSHNESSGKAHKNHLILWLLNGKVFLFFQQLSSQTVPQLSLEKYF